MRRTPARALLMLAIVIVTLLAVGGWLLAMSRGRYDGPRTDPAAAVFDHAPQR